MGMPGHDQLITIGGEPVEHPGVGRMRDTQAQVRPRVGRPGDGVVAIPAQVRVVDAGGRDGQSGHLEFAPGVGQVQPAALVERRPQVLPGQRLTVDAVIGISEVLCRALQRRREIVVAAEDEHPGHR